ncbi:MAG: hypothetical protein AB1746_00055 [Candidatus Zixiibacteriota bacterium]
MQTNNAYEMEKLDMWKTMQNPLNENSTESFNHFSEDTKMTDERRTSLTEDRHQDAGASIIAGAVVCLAIYGVYKLFEKEEKKPPVMLPPNNSGILDRLLEMELR